MKTLCPKCWKKQKMEMNFCPRCKVRLVDANTKVDVAEMKQIDKKVKSATVHELEKDDKFMGNVKEKLMTETRWLTYFMVALFVFFFIVIVVYFFIK